MQEEINLDEYTIEVIDNPSNDLDSKVLEEMASQCVPVARKAFGNEGMTKSDALIHALEADTGIYVRDDSDQIVGFGSCVLEEISGEKIIHLKGTAISPEHTGQGLYKVITPLRALRENEKVDGDFFIGSRTQNPIVVQYMSKELEMYPRPGVETPPDIRKLSESYAEYIQRKHSDFVPEAGITFIPEDNVVKRVYGGRDPDGNEFGVCMYGDGEEDVPTARDEQVDEFVRSRLDFENGDAMILMSRFRPEPYIESLSSACQRLDTMGKLYERFSQ